MSQVLYAFLLFVATSAAAQTIPAELLGKWVIQRVIPTSTISCWGDKEAKRIIGTEVEYATGSFKWEASAVNHPVVDVVVLTAEQFREEYSGADANSSQVSFRQLGIRMANAKRVSIKHAPANITGGTTEIPGDTVLIKDEHHHLLRMQRLFRGQTGSGTPLTFSPLRMLM
jgi:hypothetical protein